MSDNSDMNLASDRVLPLSPEVMGRIERRWDGLPARIEAKLQTIKDLDRGSEVRLINQAAIAGTTSKRIMWLRKSADSLVSSAGHLAACSKGCDACCHIAVMISRAEAQVIAKETGAQLNANAGVISMANMDDYEGAFRVAKTEAYGVPCPFLLEGQCSVYASRPLQCRLLLNLDEDALLCQSVGAGENNVPHLNTREHHIASVSILGAHQDYDDIRNWFPAPQRDLGHPA